MEENKKNNKVLIVGLIFILVLCLIYSLFFMYKMISVNQQENNVNESNNKDTTNNELQEDSVVFTELTKYTLEEGEEKEVTVDGNKIVIKKENDKIYFNGNIIDEEEKTYIKNSTYVYVANKLLIFTRKGQNGETYVFTDESGNVLDITEEYKNLIFSNLKIDNNNLLVDGIDTSKIDLEYSVITINNYYIEPCDLILNNNRKKIEEYETFIKENENYTISATYKIKYENKFINLEFVKNNETLKEFIEKNNNLCVIEESN